MLYGYCYPTKIGQMYVLEHNEKIIEMGLGCPVNQRVIQKETPLIKEAIKQITLYFDGKLKTFSLPLIRSGTEFQEKVWEALEKIPYGETRSYEDIAIMIGKDKAARAVGQACHNNPIMIVVPCHRVIGKNNKMGGFASDIEIKKYLLNLEINARNIEL
jgi:methylated-DNA-[protein]-cysteine S-methyltransferase